MFLRYLGFRILSRETADFFFGLRDGTIDFSLALVAGLRTAGFLSVVEINLHPFLHPLEVGAGQDIRRGVGLHSRHELQRRSHGHAQLRLSQTQLKLINAQTRR